MDVMAKMTSTGQITVPKAVRDALELDTGDDVLFRVDGRQVVMAKIPDFLELAGSVPVPPELRGASWEEIRETMLRTRYADGAPRHGRSVVPPDLIVAETVYVLESVFRLGRAGVALRIRSLLALPTVRVLNRRALERALDRYEVDRLDFPEASWRWPGHSTSTRSCRSTGRSTAWTPCGASSPHHHRLVIAACAIIQG